MYNKITVGFVIQNFDAEGNCVAQEFICGDDVTWELDHGSCCVVDLPTKPDGNDLCEYQPFDMVQPQQVEE